MWLNKQETKELTIFQKYIVQNLYIKKLNEWLDELSWELEKKDALIDIHEKEIERLKDLNFKLACRLEKEINMKRVAYYKGKKVIIR